MFSTKRRLAIFLIVIIGAGISVGSIFLARYLNLGSNEQDPLYFDSPTYSKFAYNNGSQVMDLLFTSTPLNSTHYQAEISYGLNVVKFNVTPDGRFIDNGLVTNNYSIFWVHIVKSGTAGSELQEHVGRNFSIWDNIGILGSPNTEYVLTITAQDVYWPEEGPLLGAHFSLVFEIRTLSNVLVATGEMDYTCGMLFFLNIGGTGNLSTLKLLDTNYDISRNRLTGFPVVIASIIATPIILFLYLKYKRKEDMAKIIDTTFLVAMGGIIIAVDFFVDIWMYAPLGRGGNLYLHLGVIAAFSIFCLWRKFDLKWGLIPGFLEVAYVFTITLVTGDSYVPHLTAFMGLTITWLIMVWASGVQHYQAKTRLGKLIKQFV